MFRTAARRARIDAVIYFAAFNPVSTHAPFHYAVSTTYCNETENTMKSASAANTIALHSIRVESPCTASWANMRGDDRVRHCNDCNKNVFNLSAMPEAEAAALLNDNVDGALCVRFYTRADGTVMTSDCSISTRAATRRTLRKVPVMAGAALLAVSAASVALAEPAPVDKTAKPEVVTLGYATMGAPEASPTAVAPAAAGSTAVLPARPVATRMMGKPLFQAAPPTPVKNDQAPSH